MGDVCRVIGGFGFKAADYLKDGIPLIKIGNIQNGGIVVKPDNDCLPSEWLQDKSLRKYILEPNDVLIALTGATLGKVGVVGSDIGASFLNQRVGKIQPVSPDINLDFVVHAIGRESFQAEIKQAILKSAQGNVSPSAIEEIEIHLPPLAQQRAIAQVLRTVREAKETRLRELVLERERKDALMRYLFTHGNHGEPRKQTEIGEIPASWQLIRLSDSVVVKGGKRLPKGESLVDEATRFPYLRVTDFRNGSVALHNIKYVPTDVQPAIARYTISSDDIYISIAGSIGIVGTIPSQLDGANLTENAAKLVIKNRELMDRDFLTVYLSGDVAQRQIASLTTKNAQPKLALTRIETILVPLPPIPEQRAIARAILCCKAKMDALEEESGLLEELFTTLLEELMTGEIPLIEAEVAT